MDHHAARSAPSPQPAIPTRQTAPAHRQCLGQLIRKTDPETDVTYENGFRERAQPVTRYGYDLAGRLVSKLNANGVAETQQVLAGSTAQSVKVQTSWDGAGGMQRMDYTAFGETQLRQVRVDSRLVHTRYDYDGAGRLVQQQQLGFDGQGITRRLEDGSLQNLGVLTDRYRYDGLGRRISHSNTLNDTDTTDYDSLGRVTRTVSAGGAETRYQYRYVAIGSQDGILGAGGRDLGGYQKTTTDASGRTSHEWVDYFERTVRRVDQGGRRFDYAYNLAGWLMTQRGSGYDQWGVQHLQYQYFANGYIQAAYDLTNKTVSAYYYDNAGLRTRETYGAIDANRAITVYYQDATLHYDELGRLARARDRDAFTVDHEYDALGNRRRVRSYHHDGTQGLRQLDDFWYSYDRANRFTTSMGGLLDTQGNTLVTNEQRGTSRSDRRYRIDVTGTQQGVQLAYDAAGQRVAAYSVKSGKHEVYAYRADGFLETTAFDGQVRARRILDQLGRTVTYRDEVNHKLTHTEYDRDHRLLKETRYSDGQAGEVGRHDVTRYYYFNQQGTGNPADVQNSEGYHGALAKSMSWHGGDWQSTTSYDYEYWDTARQTNIWVDAKDRDGRQGRVSLSYDANGYIRGAADHVDHRVTRYITASNGQILQRAVGLRDKAFTHWYYYANNQRIGDVANDPAALQVRLSYAEQLAQKDQTVSLSELYRNAKPVTSSDFDQNYEPINEQYPGNAPGAYTVRASGETLHSIARSLWGDEAMWYLLADANGLKGDEALTPGQNLVIPNKVTNIHNNSNTFRPYNPGEAMGRLDPTVPAPVAPQGKKGCGVHGRTLAGVVAAVVTLIVSAYAGPVVGAMAGNAAGQYSTMMINGQFDYRRFMTMQSNPFAGSRNDLAAVAFGNAGETGAPGQFNYQSVAISAAAAYVGMEIGGMAASATNSAVIGAMTQAAVSQGASYGLNRLAGNDPQFSLREMGVNVAMAGVMQPAFGTGKLPQGRPWSRHYQGFDTSIGNTDWGAALPSSFQLAGDALLNMLQAAAKHWLNQELDRSGRYRDKFDARTTFWVEAASAATRGYLDQQQNRAARQQEASQAERSRQLAGVADLKLPQQSPFPADPIAYRDLDQERDIDRWLAPPRVSDAAPDAPQVRPTPAPRRIERIVESRPQADGAATVVSATRIVHADLLGSAAKHKAARLP
ncbi:LysM peptidoglycan-binding domain-containing protein [Chitinivorax sp. B]|uniref:LysM peptidoglycan-binding domain-containing protein n=1 Tax=Chitinivorax sp. B TaxID=2502235 RepID=UPI0010F4F8E2|nr:LysM peptidoglycan-binding domain-containing protein [Chitinivorax sp. B]